VTKKASGSVSCLCGEAIVIDQQVYYPDDPLSIQAAERYAKKQAVLLAEKNGWQIPSRQDFLRGKPDLCPKCRDKV